MEYTKDSSEEPEDRPVSAADNSDSDFTPSIKEEEDEALESKSKTKKRAVKSTAARSKKPKLEAPETSTQSSVGKAQKHTEMTGVKVLDKVMNLSVKDDTVILEHDVKNVNVIKSCKRKLNDKCVDKYDSKIEDVALILNLDNDSRVTAIKKKITLKINMKKQLQNLRTILKCTNATPIRCRGRTGYLCCYCDDEYLKAEDLKIHTLEKHYPLKEEFVSPRKRKPDTYIVKLDITLLRCNVCMATSGTLEEVMQHLKEAHNKIIHMDINNHMLPFKFDSEPLKCVLCSKTDDHFYNLLLHMSVHYRNYECECGATFLTLHSLRMHKRSTHPGAQAEYACSVCDKVFRNGFRKACHEKNVHEKGSRKMKCPHCDVVFSNYSTKRKHMTEAHGSEPRVLRCNACDKVFSDRRWLTVHVKRDHLLERRHECTVCDKKFFSKPLLSAHMLKHTGAKNFHCQICSKAYGKRYTLREHMRIHDNDRRFKCEHCGQSFVQKCSWKGHMLSKHGVVASRN